MPKWRNFAKSGRAASHDGRNRRNEEKNIDFCPTDLFITKDNKTSRSERKKRKTNATQYEQSFPGMGNASKEKNVLTNWKESFLVKWLSRTLSNYKLEVLCSNLLEKMILIFSIKFKHRKKSYALQLVRYKFRRVLWGLKSIFIERFEL